MPASGDGPVTASVPPDPRAHQQLRSPRESGFAQTVAAAQTLDGVATASRHRQPVDAEPQGLPLRRAAA